MNEDYLTVITNDPTAAKSSLYFETNLFFTYLVWLTYDQWSLKVHNIGNIKNGRLKKYFSNRSVRVKFC